MTEEEIKECRYIEDELKFCTFQEFVESAEAIKRQYEELTSKIFYRWYVFANPSITLRKKVAIWEYLNNDITYSKLTKN